MKSLLCCKKEELPFSKKDFWACPSPLFSASALTLTLTTLSDWWNAKGREIKQNPKNRKGNLVMWLIFTSWHAVSFNFPSSFFLLLRTPQRQTCFYGETASGYFPSHTPPIYPQGSYAPFFFAISDHMILFMHCDHLFMIIFFVTKHMLPFSLFFFCFMHYSYLMNSSALLCHILVSYLFIFKLIHVLLGTQVTGTFVL